jgi:glycosyltransferase involved in cell wall biosynthesis
VVNLAFYTENYLIGGAERYLSDLLGGLDSCSYEIVLLSNRNPAFKHYLVTRNLINIPHRVVPLLPPVPHWRGLRKTRPVETAADTERPKNTLRNQKKDIGKGLWRYTTIIPNLILLTAVFRSQPIDILHVNNGGYPAAETCRLAPLAARLAGIPICVMTVHNLAQPLHWPESVERKLDRLVEARLDAVIGMSKAVAESMQSDRGFDPRKVHAFDLGIDLARSQQNATQDWRAQMGVSPTATLIGTVGSFEIRKGHRYLIEAFHQIIGESKTNELYLVLVGNGETRPLIEQKVQKMGIESRVIFTGYRTDAAHLISAFDILVVPSTGFEGQGYVVLEAMAHAKPVIASRVGGFPETVVDGETGLLVPPANCTALAAALRRLLTDESLRQSMGAAGCRRYAERFTLGRLLANTQSLYAELLAMEKND